MRQQDISTSEDHLDSFICGATSLLLQMKSDMEKAEVWVRDSHTDLVLGAHLSRIFQTTDTVMSLCRLRKAADAASLARVVVEHAISLAYLCTTDTDVRCSALVWDSLTEIGRAHKAVGEHFPGRFPIDEKRANAAISVGHEANYQSKLGGQLADLKGREPFSFLWDLVYPALSQYAHPRAAGLDDFAPSRREPFTFREPKDVRGIVVRPP